MPRTVRLLGVVVLVTGVWTAIVPFVGPSLSFASPGATAWTWTPAHWQLGLAPGLAAAVAGFTMFAGHPVEVWFAKLMAYAAGLWLLVGPSVASLWLGPRQALTDVTTTGSDVGVAVGYLIAPGIVLVTAAALAAGRRVATIVGAAVTDVDEAPLSVGDWA